MSTNANRTIEIIVKTDGQTVVETKGFTGTSCQDASRFIEQALGTRESEQLTAEFHQSVTRHDAKQRASH